MKADGQHLISARIECRVDWFCACCCQEGVLGLLYDVRPQVAVGSVLCKDAETQLRKIGEEMPIEIR